MKYTVYSVICCQIETDNKNPKKEAIKFLDENLPPEFDFAINSIKKHRPKRPGLGKFSLDEVLPFISEEPCRKEYVIGNQVFPVRMDGTRYECFKESISCASCGLTGEIFYLENSGSLFPHFNLYAKEDGELVLMTQDHIVPKQKGGSNDKSNLQTMCCICNSLKGSLNLSLKSISKLRNLYNAGRRGMTKEEYRQQMSKLKKSLEGK
jgi:hypothetical protein